MKHFIITRFFSESFGKSKQEMLDMLDNNTLLDGFSLLQNHFIKTLNNQTCKNFEIIILIYNMIPLEKVDFLKNISSDVKVTVLHSKELDDYIYKYYVDNDIIITTRLDYDDFIHKDCVRDLQERAANTKCFKVYGLNNGCSMDDSEICYLHHPKYVDLGNGFFSCFESLVTNTQTYKMPINIYKLGVHSNICKTMHEKYADFGLASVDDLEIECDSDTRTKYIWYRHDKSVSYVTRNKFLHLSNIVVNDVAFEDFGYDAKNKLL